MSTFMGNSFIQNILHLYRYYFTDKIGKKPRNTIFNPQTHYRNMKMKNQQKNVIRPRFLKRITILITTCTMKLFSYIKNLKKNGQHPMILKKSI